MKALRSALATCLMAIGLIAALIFGARLTPIVNAQQNVQQLFQDVKAIMTTPNAIVAYTPTQFYENAVTLPASSTTAGSLIVNTARVHQATLSMNCTQITNVNIIVYAEDGVTQLGSYAFVTGVAAGWQQIFIASELAPNTTSGTVAVNVRFPQPYVQVSFFNTTATPGTCSARWYSFY